MTPLSTDTRAEIVRLHATGLSHDAIAQLVGVGRSTVGNVCRNHFEGLVANAKTVLAREILEAKRERLMGRAPLFHPEHWG
jgi:DNA-binding NarL/FixJ family response regulator